MSTFFSDALPVPISGPVGTGKVSLLDLLTQAYGDNVSQIQSVSISELDASQLAANNLSYWDPAHPVLTKVLNNGADIGGSENGNFVTVDAAHFKDVQIAIGNNIASNVFVTVPESSGNGDFVGRTLSVTALPQQLDAHLPSGHVPTAADIVSTARMFASVENGVANANDCHNIASAIAASAGATLDAASGNTANPALNEEGGFWHIAYRGTDAGAVDAWQDKVQAGDIVRMARTDGGVHTVTVTAGINADGNHPGQIEVVDNWNGKISEHWDDYDNNTVKGSVTVYRLGTDGMYLTDQSSDSHNNNILGTQFNDLIKGGSGNDTLSGGRGNDTIDGGGGDNTAVFSGRQSDYKVTLNGGTAIISDQRAGAIDGTDTIKNIEHVRFADGTVNFGDLKATPVEPAPAAAGSVAINDSQIVEGNNGSQVETFTVMRTGGTGAFDVNFATSDGTATAADGDYVAKTGTVHFNAGDTSQTVSVVVNGDTKVEPNENYHVNLSGATNGATISHGEGTGTIVNDDAAPAAGSVAIGNATITEGNHGSQIETFAVTRTGGAGAFDVNFATSDGTATAADHDYVAKTGTVHFDAGVNTQTVSVQVNGDTKVESNENYHVNLSGATNGATISHGEGTGTIVNDDTSPTHSGGFFDDIARVIAKAVGDGGSTRTGNVLTDGLNAFAHAVATAAGDGSPTHNGSVFIDGLAAAAHAIANDVGAGTHGGSFWDQAADAIHLFTGSGGVAPHSPANVSGPILTPQTPAADLHSTGLAGMFGDIANHPSDTGHIGSESAHVTQENHAYPHFEVPALHMTEFALHH